jgi:hypothetical protein
VYGAIPYAYIGTEEYTNSGRRSWRGSPPTGAATSDGTQTRDFTYSDDVVDDWLASDMDIDSIASPKTSVATGIELQYVMEDVWERDRLARAHRTIAETRSTDRGVDGRNGRAAVGIRVGDRVRRRPPRHRTLGEPIVSTDTLFPDIEEVTHVDPRDVD